MTFIGRTYRRRHVGVHFFAHVRSGTCSRRKQCCKFVLNLVFSGEGTIGGQVESRGDTCFVDEESVGFYWCKCPPVVLSNSARVGSLLRS